MKKTAAYTVMAFLIFGIGFVVGMIIDKTTSNKKEGLTQPVNCNKTDPSKILKLFPPIYYSKISGKRLNLAALSLEEKNSKEYNKNKDEISTLIKAGLIPEKYSYPPFGVIDLSKYV